jgi:nucleotide-binding universal stress UspA family protein
MTMYRNIVIGFDGSDFSHAALQEASAWLSRHGGKGLLVQAVYFDEEEFGMVPDLLAKRLVAAKTASKEAARQAAVEFGVAVTEMIREGEAAKVVTEAARQHGADLIVLGTHGRRGFKRLLIGSVTAEVLLNAPCDVLVVKQECQGCTGHYRTLLVPFDGSPASRHALERGCQLARLDQGVVHVVYVIPRYEEMLDFWKTAAMETALRDEATKLLLVAKEQAAEVGVAVQPHLAEGSVPEEIGFLAEQLGVDLIVMGSHGWRGMDKSIIGSTAERVMMGAHTPLLVTREGI